LQPSADRTVKTEKEGRNWAEFDPLKTEKKGFYRSVTVQSNCTLAFVFNKDAMGGGSLAEGRRQRAVEIADIAVIADIARDRKSKTSQTHANLCPSTRKPRVDGARLG